MFLQPIQSPSLNLVTSSRRSAGWGATGKTTSEKIGEKRCAPTIFSLAGFRAAPQLTERLEGAMNLDVGKTKFIECSSLVYKINVD